MRRPVRPTLARLLLVTLALACRTGSGPRGGQSVAPVAPPPDPTLAMAPPQALAALATRYWDEQLRAHPMLATEIGDRRFDDRLSDPTPAGRDREIARLAALRARVASLPDAALSGGDRVTRSLLLGEIDTGLALKSCALDDWAVDARDGTQVGFMRLPELQPVRTVAEGWTFVARMEKMGGFIDQETANLRRGLAAGKVATAEEIGRVLGQLDDLLSKPDDKWPLRAPAAAPARGLAAARAAGVPARGRRRARPPRSARPSSASAPRSARRSCRARATRRTRGS